jgi:TFIIF-interacting CTD phosphatase-like protein
MTSDRERESRVREEIQRTGRELRENSEKNGKPQSQQAAEKYARELFERNERRNPPRK